VAPKLCLGLQELSTGGRRARGWHRHRFALSHLFAPASLSILFIVCGLVCDELSASWVGYLYFIYTSKYVVTGHMIYCMIPVQIVINKLSILLNLLIGLDQTLNKSNKFLRPVILSLRLWSVDTHGEEPLGNNISQHFRINVDLSTFTTEDNILD
jgi:hypothetical protein